jgi:hypothetical protein
MPVIREKTQNNRDNRLFLNNSIAIFRSGTIESCPKIECQAFFGASPLLSARRDRKIIPYPAVESPKTTEPVDW